MTIQWTFLPSLVQICFVVSEKKMKMWNSHRVQCYGPWQPCLISNLHQKHKSGRGPSIEHFWQVWLKSVQRFQRRRFKCEKLTDGRTTDAYPWQKLTWPMARWAKKLEAHVIIHGLFR
jgi:hypothetical protein